MTSAAVPIRFVVGSRKLFEVPRQLGTISMSLEALIAGDVPQLDDAQKAGEGLRCLSFPAAFLRDAGQQFQNYVIGGVQSYPRHYIDMRGTFDGYMERFSGKTRSTLRRKQRKLAELAGGNYEVEEFGLPDEIERFLAEAIPLSRRTYQARLLDAGLPEGEAAQSGARALAAADRLRAYLLRIEGKAIAYLYLPIEGETLVYAYLGYDPDHAASSPGTVLQLEALEKLFKENRFRYFDFTEGEGAHKAMFSTDHVPACSFFLLKRSLGNRLLLGSLDLFDGSVAQAKQLAGRSGVLSAARRMLRR